MERFKLKTFYILLYFVTLFAYFLEVNAVHTVSLELLDWTPSVNLSYNTTADNTYYIDVEFEPLYPGAQVHDLCLTIITPVVRCLNSTSLKAPGRWWRFYNVEPGENYTVLVYPQGKDLYFYPDDSIFIPDEVVQLQPPRNLTAGLTGNVFVFLYWLPPQNFMIHVFNQSVFDVNNSSTSSGEETKLSFKPKNNEIHIWPNMTYQPPQGNSSSKETNKSTGTLFKHNSTTHASNETSNNSKSDSDIKDTLVNSTSTVIDSSDKSVENGTGTMIDSSGKSVQNGTGTMIDSSGKSVQNGTKNAGTAGSIHKNEIMAHGVTVTKYLVTWRKVGDDKASVVHVPGNVTHCWLNNLQSNSNYTVHVSAVYPPGNVLDSAAIQFQTKRTTPGMCNCDVLGSIGGPQACNVTGNSTFCTCRKGYKGSFCEECDSGYYRTGVNLPCHICPCDTLRSTGECHFVRGYLHCSRCNQGYIGTMCHRCDNGFYREMNQHMIGYNTGNFYPTCMPCRGCHVTSYPGLICDPYTGQCMNCLYNTHGHRCEKCKPGYMGDPHRGIPCAKQEAAVKALSPAGIAGICLAAIVVLCVIGGTIVYCRMKKYPRHRPFWTIELKEDHEGVNFSAVPEDELQSRERQMEDMNFYEKQQGKAKGSSQPYSQLREEI